MERHASLLRAGPTDGGLERATQQFPDQTGTPVVIVLDGVVKVFHARWDGPNVLVDVAGVGDVLNAEEFLTGATITRFTPYGNATLLAIPRERFAISSPPTARSCGP
ncbi:MAG: hypothetical protein ACRDRA_07210 [Pseudonocardiaceae bacterium]